MFVAWYSAEFWRTNLDDVPCTVEEMEAAADGAFVLGFYYWNPVLEKGIAGLTGKLAVHNSIIDEGIFTAINWWGFCLGILLLEPSLRNWHCRSNW